MHIARERVFTHTLLLAKPFGLRDSANLFATVILDRAYADTLLRFSQLVRVNGAETISIATKALAWTNSRGKHPAVRENQYVVSLRDVWWTACLNASGCEFSSEALPLSIIADYFGIALPADLGVVRSRHSDKIAGIVTNPALDP